MQLRVDGAAMKSWADGRQQEGALQQRRSPGESWAATRRNTPGPVLRLNAGIVVGLIVASGCTQSEQDEPSPGAPGHEEAAMMAPLEIGDDHIRASNGTKLLRIEDLPGDIQVDEQTAFGAADRFREAEASPDEAWLAVTTSGAAHGAGWLVQTDSGQASPAAFQYGGSVTVGPWSEDGRYAVFVQEGPAGDRTLTVVDRESPSDSMDASAYPVRAPVHDDLSPEQRQYDATGWAEGKLLFRLGDKQWAFDPEAMAVMAK
ncbi:MULTISPECIES: hypothetical protein [unclassified Thioalkalivibrio]|uniref:hypothetical protein n=1 Tax=unclassified Thioalkalivibrio TaxID=2621013 RepID=UPI0004782D61|nr:MULTISPECIES: hypothetical protein [unclassified Thioalkalivibrio]